MKRNFKAVVGLVAGLTMAATSAWAANITGAGSTFVYPIIAKWATTYQGTSGSNVNYQSIGSGGGIAQVKAKTVTFGATDKPLTASELNAAGLVQFPVIVGGIVPVVHLPGINPGQLVLNGKVLASIYLGTVKMWNDPAIKALNPKLNLPATAIIPVHRSDGSGTTFNFTTYLGKVDPNWLKTVGADTAVDWVGGVGAKGNEGVAGNVAQLAGSIGYVEYAYAKQNHLTYARMINKAGKTVEPTIATFRSAAASADWVGAAKSDFYVLFLESPGADAWPISATTFVLVYKNPSDQAATANALKFFQWGMEKGDQLATSLDYVPLPDNAVKAIETSWKGIQGSGF
jgi:phosphate transport system substrate-binding protein